jgi:hypothetical protein
MRARVHAELGAPKGGSVRLKRTARTRFGLLVASSFLALPLSNCGGYGGSPAGPPTPTPTPTPNPPQVIAQGNFTIGGIDTPNFAVFFPFTTSQSGRLDITVDWTLASNDLDFGVARGACDLAMLEAEQCAEVATAESTTKPETLSLPSFQAGAYTLVVDNQGPAAESGTYQVVLQP